MNPLPEPPLALYFLGSCLDAVEQLKVEHLQIDRKKKKDGKLEWDEDDYKKMDFTQCIPRNGQGPSKFQLLLGATEFLEKSLSDDKIKNLWQHVVHKAFNAVSTMMKCIAVTFGTKKTTIAYIDLMTSSFGDQENPDISGD
ncbi:hypothetical protein J5N97_010647 [Dioscorea zingiberensis]|uniref:Uncharacterized protein n=1 Tax=Dioscorea zingiberensis TaxID=325984 RepID=A0A9D5D130_9LILI|nr:hypothetical protein J5N97_010647 [Dioscorea zingiberensis]